MCGRLFSHRYSVQNYLCSFVLLQNTHHVRGGCKCTFQAIDTEVEYINIIPGNGIDAAVFNRHADGVGTAQSEDNRLRVRTPIMVDPTHVDETGG